MVALHGICNDSRRFVLTDCSAGLPVRIGTASQIIWADMLALWASACVPSAFAKPWVYGRVTLCPAAVAALAMLHLTCGSIGPPGQANATVHR